MSTTKTGESKKPLIDFDRQEIIRRSIDPSVERASVYIYKEMGADLFLAMHKFDPPIRCSIE